MHRLSFIDAELATAAQPLREAPGADLLIGNTHSIAPARIARIGHRLPQRR